MRRPKVVGWDLSPTQRQTVWAAAWAGLPDLPWWGGGLDCLASTCSQRGHGHFTAWQLHPEPAPTAAGKNMSEGEDVCTAWSGAPGCSCEYLCTVERQVLTYSPRKSTRVTTMGIAFLFCKTG